MGLQDEPLTTQDDVDEIESDDEFCILDHPDREPEVSKWFYFFIIFSVLLCALIRI